MADAPGDDYCYLTTTGRRTGKPHRIEIWYADAGDTLYLLARGRDRSDWVRNLAADASCLVELAGEARRAIGRILGDGDEAERARSLVFDKYAPRYDGDLTAWRERALPVALGLEEHR
jgi:deazaflavin-dependent oxidoreductase (nitroreductase family)